MRGLNLKQRAGEGSAGNDRKSLDLLSALTIISKTELPVTEPLLNGDQVVLASPL
jgi:hypothetical protein